MLDGKPRKYSLWLRMGGFDLTDELKATEGNEDEIYDRFYRELEFGTGDARRIGAEKTG